MPSTIVDSAIFGDIFSAESMRRVWSDENRTQKYLDIEAALARVQGRLGIIPQDAADEIVRHCTIAEIDMAKLRQQTERIGYPILGVVSQLGRRRRTSPTPRPCCRFVRRSRSSTTIFLRFPHRWPTSLGVTATRR